MTMAPKQKSFVAAAVGLIIMALPMTAMAHHWDRDDAECNIRNGNPGRHLGWYKHQGDTYSNRFRGRDADDYRFRCDGDGDDCRPNPQYEGWRGNRRQSGWGNQPTWGNPPAYRRPVYERWYQGSAYNGGNSELGNL